MAAFCIAAFLFLSNHGWQKKGHHQVASLFTMALQTDVHLY
jgi:hypothetical protein